MAICTLRIYFLYMLYKCVCIVSFVCVCLCNQSACCLSFNAINYELLQKYCIAVIKPAGKQQQQTTRTHSRSEKAMDFTCLCRASVAYLRAHMHGTAIVCIVFVASNKILSFYYLYMVLNLIWQCRQLSPQHSPALSPVSMLCSTLCRLQFLTSLLLFSNKLLPLLLLFYLQSEWLPCCSFRVASPFIPRIVAVLDYLQQHRSDSFVDLFFHYFTLSLLPITGSNVTCWLQQQKLRWTFTVFG